MAAPMDARVADYLDDKIQTLADLDTLDSLLIDVRNKQSLLKKQLQEANKELDNAKKASVEHGQKVKRQVQEFNRQQDELDKKLRAVTNSSSSDEPLRKFEASMQKLEKMNALKDYLRLLRDVDQLSQQCLSQLGSNDAAALEAYLALKSLRVKMHPLQVAADGAAPHLIDHIEDKVDELREQIEKVFSAQLEAALKKISWPRLDVPISEDQQRDISNAISKLLDLQRPELEAQEAINDGYRTVQPLELLPLQVMVGPLELGFRYHFEGDRPTNRLERPEFFLSHVIEQILERYIDTIESLIQPILLQNFKGSDLGLNYAYIDATSAFINSLLPMVRNKLQAILPQIEKQPPLLSHLVHELIKFDALLRDEWQYDGGSRGQQWQGLAYEILATDSVFSRWLQAEKEFALSRYNDIVDEAESFELDFDSVGPGKTKPSKAAIRVNDLLEATTDNYRGLTSFAQKLRFLIDIQISIFDMFHGRLAEALSAYQARTSTITRNSYEDQMKFQGVAGLESLSRIYGSADYLERAMRDWNDDVFFLELWSELKHRSAQQSAHTVVAGSMTVAQVAARTSSSIANESNSILGEQDFEEGALFDETADSYSRLRTKVEDIMSELLANNVRQALSKYTKVNLWSSLQSNAASSDAQLPTTAELDGLLQSLRTLLLYLNKAIGTVPLRRIIKQTLQTIDNIIIDQVIIGHSFSTAGASQLAADVKAINNMLSRYIDNGAVRTNLARLNQAAKLLSIVAIDKDEEDIDDREQIGLFEASKVLYEGSGEDARKMLEEMGLERLSVADARKILVRRVELNS